MIQSIQTIQRWGNSQGIRIPKTMLKAADLAVNDRVELKASPEEIVIRRAEPNKHRTLRERFEAFYGQPFDEIPRITLEPEVDWGEPVGKEVW